MKRFFSRRSKTSMLDQIHNENRAYDTAVSVSYALCVQRNDLSVDDAQRAVCRLIGDIKVFLMLVDDVALTEEVLEATE